MSENSTENLKIQLETEIILYKRAIAENKPFKEARKHYLEAKKLEAEVKRREKSFLN